MRLLKADVPADPGGVGHGEGDGARRGLRHPADVGAVQRGHRALRHAAAAALLQPRLHAPLLRPEPVAHRVPGLRQVLLAHSAHRYRVSFPYCNLRDTFSKKGRNGVTAGPPQRCIC